VLTDPDAATIMTEQNKEQGLPDLPVALKLQDRQELEMIVLDRDPLDAQEFLERLGIEIGEGDDALATCKEWLRRIKRGEQGRLQIRWEDKGPTMDLSE
jgi:hypothetical protein